jgi:hypothetical protein
VETRNSPTRQTVWGTREDLKPEESATYAYVSSEVPVGNATAWTWIVTFQVNNRGAKKKIAVTIPRTNLLKN